MDTEEGCRKLDLIDAMVVSADGSVDDEESRKIEMNACPGCGCCSGMFTANSMNCLTEAIGMALPGNGTIVATHKRRIDLFKKAAQLIVRNAHEYYENGNESVLPKNICTRQAFLNAMTLDIAMGGSTNTVLHLLAVANEAGVDFRMKDIDELSRKVPCICKVAPNTAKYHVQDVNRAGGIVAIMNELAKGGLVDASLVRVDGLTLAQEIDKYCITMPFNLAGTGTMNPHCTDEAKAIYSSASGNKFSTVMGSQETYSQNFDADRAEGCIRDLGHAYSKDGGLAVLFGNIAKDGCVVKTAGVDESIWKFTGWHPGRQDTGRRCGSDHLRRPERRPWNAGNALPYFLHKIHSPRKAVRPHYRWPLQRRHLRIEHRAHLARSSRRRKHRPGQRRGHNRNRHRLQKHKRKALRRRACGAQEAGNGERA